MHLHKLDFHVRAELDAASPRCLAVLHPLRLTLTNLAPSHHTYVSAKVRMCAADPRTKTRLCCMCASGSIAAAQQDIAGLPRCTDCS